MKNWAIALIIPILLALNGCGGGGDAPRVDTTPDLAAAVSPADGSALTDRAGITISFNRAMDRASLNLDGSLAPDVDGTAFSTTTHADDTLIITPNTTWTNGANQTLVVDIADASGEPLATLTLHYKVVHGTLYHVNAAAVDDSGDGLTPSTAKKTIMAAVNAATAPASLLIAEGTYNVNSDPAVATHIILKEGVSLYGGFNSAFDAYDPLAHVSEVVDNSTYNGTLNTNNTPNTAIFGDDSSTAITTATVIEGLTLTGGGGEFSAAVHLSFAAPTICNNTIHGGTGATYSSGILATYAGAVIEANTVNGGGEGGFYSIGVGIGGTAVPLVANNVINGGSAWFPTGISVGSQGKIINNTIDGGKGTNVIQTFGISVGSGAVIQNNIIFTSNGSTRVCIREGVDPGDPAQLQNNDMFDCPTALYADYVGTGGNCFSGMNNCYSSAADVNTEAYTTQGASGTADSNFSVDAGFIDRANGDFHLDGMASPSAIAFGGIDLSSSITVDKDDVARTVPWSMGAYEYLQ